MKYHNTRTGAETDIFSDEDWKSGQPQRAGWVNTEDKPLKTAPKDIVDFVFKKKPVEPVVIETIKGETISISEDKVEKTLTEKSDFATGGIITGKQKVELPGSGEIVIPAPPSQIRKLAESKLKQSKPKRNDNPKQKRPAAKR
jgi:hypothetical protein